ncbi:MAG: ribose-phosphate pyrophosphokinase [Mycoplasmataceae bacterium]|nr:ribose-phosphate pyrophosphokinase [Mycoplasmataceae bacterium]
MPNVEDLGLRISKEIEIPLTKIKYIKYADGETMLSSERTVRNKNVFVIASTSMPVNDNYMELLLFIDSLKRASAKTITIAISYYGYARQDRKAKGRQPIGAKMIADLLKKVGATKIIAVDLHNPSIQGFFDIPLDDLKAQYILAPEIKKSGKFTIASPDHGGAVRARVLADIISNSVDIAIVDKRRTGPNESKVMGVLGRVKGNNVVILDDMIDTGGTIIKAAEALKNAGANKIIVAATHGLFNNGFELFDNCDEISSVIVTDTVPAIRKLKGKKLKIVSVSGIISTAIRATAEGKSISEAYAKMKKKM